MAGTVTQERSSDERATSWALVEVVVGHAHRSCFGVLPVKVAQVAWASRPRDRLFVHRSTTTYEAPISGVSYGEHGKAADESAEGVRARPTIFVTHDRPVLKGLRTFSHTL